MAQVRLRRREQRGHHSHPRPRRQGRRCAPRGLHRVLRGGTAAADDEESDGGHSGGVTAILLDIDASGDGGVFEKM